MGAKRLALLGAAAALSIFTTSSFAQSGLETAPGPVLQKARKLSAKTPALENSPVRSEEAGMDWVVMENADARFVRQELDLTRRTVLSVGSRLSLFPVGAQELPKLAGVMHEKRHRCGGYFAYASKEEALADMRFEAPDAPARTYALSRAEDVRAASARVREKRLRAVIEKLSSFYNRYFTNETGVASSRWIREEWSRIAESRPDIVVEDYEHSWDQPSVIATIPGTSEAQTVVVLGGHADSIGSMWGGSRPKAPGADDNASGIAVLTETLRVLVESGFRPERTVKFIAYAAEEVGLRGSKEIATDFQARGVDVAGVAQFDMTSSAGSGNKIFLISDFTSEAQNEYIGELIDAYVGVPWDTTACGYGCSDHASWTRRGYPASFPFESTKRDANRNIHSSRDTLDAVGGTAEHSVHFAKLAVAYAIETSKSGAAHLAAAKAARSGATR